MAGRRERKTFTEKNLLIILVVMWVFLAIATGGNFSSWANITNLIRQSSINGVVAIGMTLIIITGGIDLSVGSIVGLSGMVFAIFTSTRGEFQFPTIVGILLALGISALIGLINAVAVHDGLEGVDAGAGGLGGHLGQLDQGQPGQYQDFQHEKTSGLQGVTSTLPDAYRSPCGCRRLFLVP